MAKAPPVPEQWAELPDEQLLDLRMCDLPIALPGGIMQGRIAELQAELDTRDLRVPIHFYLSEEWFTPDGATSMAVPFYLAHPRLEKLERAQMLEVEGGDHDWCMRILRHEAGHVIDNAYKLRLRRRRESLFGASSEPYPEFYTPKPYSKNFVHAHRPLVRAEPSRRRLRRDLRGVAHAGTPTGRSATRAGRRSRSSSTWTR